MYGDRFTYVYGHYCQSHIDNTFSKLTLFEANSADGSIVYYKTYEEKNNEDNEIWTYPLCHTFGCSSYQDIQC
jgi:hypothetical protein